MNKGAHLTANGLQQIINLCISSSNLPFSNSSIFLLAFFKFSNPSHVFSSAVYPFHFTKYFVFPLFSCLFKISSTSYSFSPATSTGGGGIFFCPSTCLSRLLMMDLTFIFVSYFISLFLFFSFSIFRTTRVRSYQSRCHISNKLMA